MHRKAAIGRWSTSRLLARGTASLVLAALVVLASIADAVAGDPALGDLTGTVEVVAEEVAAVPASAPEVIDEAVPDDVVDAADAARQLPAPETLAPVIEPISENITDATSAVADAPSTAEEAVSAPTAVSEASSAVKAISDVAAGATGGATTRGTSGTITEVATGAVTEATGGAVTGATGVATGGAAEAVDAMASASADQDAVPLPSLSAAVPTSQPSAGGALTDVGPASVDGPAVRGEPLAPGAAGGADTTSGTTGEGRAALAAEPGVHPASTDNERRSAGSATMSVPDGQASPTASEGSASGPEAGSQSLPRADSSAGSDPSVRAPRSAGSIAPMALAPIRGTVMAAAARTSPGDPATVDFVAHGAAATAAVVVTAAVGSAVSAVIEFGRFGQGWAGGLVFNTWLRRQLRERRMSQRHLAQLAGIDHSTISRLLHGRTPSLDTATRLAQALGAPIPEGVPSVAPENSFDSMLPTARVERALRGDEELSDEDVRRVMDTYLALRARRRRLRVDEGSDPGAGEQ